MVPSKALVDIACGSALMDGMLELPQAAPGRGRVRARFRQQPLQPAQQRRGAHAARGQHRHAAARPPHAGRRRFPERRFDIPLLVNRLRCATRWLDGESAIVPGAGHLFEEPGALDEVARLAAGWFSGYLARTS